MNFVLMPPRQSKSAEVKNMKTLKIGVMLLALLLAAMVIVPMVSAEGSNASEIMKDHSSDTTVRSGNLVDANYIPVETAREHAMIKMIEFTGKGLLDNNWSDANVSSDPLVIYDINGNKLFYQFTAEKNGRKIGVILSSANKVLGISVKQISEPYPYDPVNVQSQAKKLTEKNFPDFSVQSIKLVCYNYPSMGIMVHIINEKTKDQRDIIYDANSLEIISQEKTKREDSVSVRSYFGQIPETAYQENIAHWNLEDTKIQTVITSAKEKNMSVENILSEQIGQTHIRAASYPSGCTDNYCELPKGFPTINQGQYQWCQVATAWVITKYYYPTNTRTLANIATKMQIPDTQHSATADNELSYYISSYQGGAATGGLGKTQSYYRTTNPSLTYETVRTEILLQHPLKVGYNGHSRACIGYSRNSGGDTYYKFSNSQGGVLQWEAAPNPYGSVTGYNDYIIVE
jgi:hypothetical protein